VKTHTLTEVADMLRLADQVKDPERWLRRRLNSRELRGVRVGRHWHMTDAHVRFMLQLYSTDDQVVEPKPVELADSPDNPEFSAASPPPVISIADGLSARSRRRLGRVPS
jgi:hypothetical protein